MNNKAQPLLNKRTEKWEIKILRHLKRFKVEKEEKKQEKKEVLTEFKIEVELEIPEIAKPDLEGKKEWIEVLCKSKKEYDAANPKE